MQKVDCVVVGAGPAGSYVAFSLARQGFDVLLAEKRPVVGVPVRCGEAAGSRAELAHFIPLHEAWIAGSIDGARLFGPGGGCVARCMPGIGTQLHRDVFDQALAAQAVSAGVRLCTGMQVTGVGPFETGCRRVEVRAAERNGEPDTLHARLVIGADGVESLVGQWLGLHKPFALGNLHSALQYLLDGVEPGERYIDLYAGRAIAPGGYAWVFPKDHGTANVGLGIHITDRTPRTARAYLDDFVHARFPQSRILRVVAGATSGAASLEHLVADGAALVGEAGHTNNPFSGGGIMNALESAEEAGEELGAALHAGDLRAARLQHYQARWHARVGRTNDRFYKLRKLFFTMDDAEIDWAIDALQRVVGDTDAANVNYTEIFRAAFTLHPKLAIKAARLLW